MGWMVFERISIPSRKRKLNKGQRKEGGNKGQGVSGRRSEKKSLCFFFFAWTTFGHMREGQDGNQQHRWPE